MSMIIPGIVETVISGITAFLGNTRNARLSVHWWLVILIRTGHALQMV